MANYVKFLRGTPTAYSNLQVKDPDTLYFIVEKGSASGILYLGTQRICAAGEGGGSGEISGFTSLSALTDTLIKNVSAGDFLVYENGKWVNKKAFDVAKLMVSVMIGASGEEDGISGLVPVPKKGDQNKFLRGDGTWAVVPDAVEFANLKTTVATLVGEDVNKSVRTIALEALTEALIPENAKESLDTIQEVAQWIQNHPDASQLNSDITNLNNTVFGHEENGEFILGLQGTVFGYVDSETDTVIPGLVTKTSNLSNLLNSLKTTVESHDKDIEILYDRLQWHDMSDEDGSIIE